MLAAIQKQLESLYDIDVGLSVEDFLCDEATLRAAQQEANARREMLLVVDEPEGLWLGLYLDEGVLKSVNRPQNLAEAWQETPHFESLCLATEGVSHFTYLAFRSRHALPVSELELELQAEVDKYASALLAQSSLVESQSLLEGQGVGLIRTLGRRSQDLRRQLFEEVSFLDGAQSLRGERYRLANRCAALYAAALERSFLQPTKLPAIAALRRELKRFYRMNLEEKMRRAQQGFAASEP